jgi:hypothetical protein
MLEKSDTSIADTLTVFNRYNLDVGLLVPTETGMKKSIMDATAGVRDYFHDTGFHDYDTQAQGPEAKVVKKAYFVRSTVLEPASASLYRPKTKSGDPRVWFSKLKGYANPHNLLAILVREDVAYIVNCSDVDVLESIHRPDTPLGAIAAASKPATDPVVEELLEMIRDVSAQGFVRTLRPGDTGIGMTLETMLGIAANTSKAPDYKGIELKAKRIRKGKANRVTLFSQVPNWKLSPIGSAWNLLSTYGYHRDGKLRLNHEMNASAPNSIGFVLEVDANRDWLRQNHQDPETAVSRHVTTWEMEKLRKRLKEKHPQTFWVGAKARGRGADEEFHYVQVEHTRQPKVRNFDALIEGGVISVDYLMSQKGPQRVRDHGYLFKMHAADFPALFPPSETYVFA